MLEDQKEELEEENSGSTSWLFLVAAGLILISVGALILVAAGLFSSGSASGGVVIFIGPFPIAFGAGPDAGLLVLVGAIIAVLSVVLFVLMRRRL